MKSLVIEFNINKTFDCEDDTNQLTQMKIKKGERFKVISRPYIDTSKSIPVELTNLILSGATLLKVPMGTFRFLDDGEEVAGEKETSEFED